VGRVHPGVIARDLLRRSREIENDDERPNKAGRSPILFLERHMSKRTVRRLMFAQPDARASLGPVLLRWNSLDGLCLLQQLDHIVAARLGRRVQRRLAI
jgi:hypothetical protein